MTPPFTPGQSLGLLAAGNLTFPAWIDPLALVAALVTQAFGDRRGGDRRPTEEASRNG